MLPEEIHNILIQDYSYNLPDNRIAKYPLKRRDRARLLVWKGGVIKDTSFHCIADYLPNNSLLVFNNTKVIRARLEFKKQTGARIEVFCLEPYYPREYGLSFAQRGKCAWRCIVGNLGKWKGGVLEKRIKSGGRDVLLSVERGEAVGGDILVTFSWDDAESTFADILDASGSVPIPPYMNRKSEESDTSRYQTVYSKVKGSVAAPTAGLHFTQDVFSSFRSKSIETAELTLHIGAATFRPVMSNVVGEHEMHVEHIVVEKRFIAKLLRHKGSVVAAGTTSMRTLESLFWMGKKVLDTPELEPSDLHVTQWEPYSSTGRAPKADEALEALYSYMERSRLEALSSTTQIMIVPGYEFRIVNGIITNFHQPQSTLLLLVSAFIGKDWRKVYSHAMDNGYRFLSYGDSNLYIRE